MRNYFENNKARCKESQMKWREKNRQYVKDYMKEYMKSYRKTPKTQNDNRPKKGLVKLEKKTNNGLKVIKKTVTIEF